MRLTLNFYVGFNGLPVHKPLFTKGMWLAAAENTSTIAPLQTRKAYGLPHARHNEQLYLKNVVVIDAARRNF